jgi:hypothetical protein
MRVIHRIGIAFAASVVLIAGAVALAEGDHGHRRNPNLGGVRTYALRDATMAATSEACDSPIVRDDTNAAIAAHLNRLGLKRNDAHPDVYVVARRTFETRYTYYGPYVETSAPGVPLKHGLPSCRSGWVAWDDWHGWNGGVYADLYDRLTVDLEDAASGVRVWRGTETKRVAQTSKPHTDVNHQVAEVFEHFPVPGAAATTGAR